MTVFSETKLSSCCFPTREEEMMVVQRKGESKTFELLLTEIQGFSYEKGFEYELLVQEKHLANPPQDVGNIEYYLIKEISKTKK